MHHSCKHAGKHKSTDRQTDVVELLLKLMSTFLKVDVIQAYVDIVTGEKLYQLQKLEIYGSRMLTFFLHQNLLPLKSLI